MAGNDNIIVTSEGGVRTVMFNRPDKKNALNHAMYVRLADELQGATDDPTIRVMVFTGAGDTFTAGNDVGDFLEVSDADDLVSAWQFVGALPKFPKPLIAAVNGPAVGVGTTMLLHCDMVYASPEARFVLPFARLGVSPEAGSSLLLPMLVGAQRASEMLMLGEPFDAEVAREVGLVTEIVPSEKLLERTAERAAALAALPPAAIRDTKRLIRSAVNDRLREVMELEGKVFRTRLASPEAAEAMTAFLEKRTPDFSKFE